LIEKLRRKFVVPSFAVGSIPTALPPLLAGM
jgi:hypothetical protein